MTRLTTIILFVQMATASQIALALPKVNLPLPQLRSDLRVDDLTCEYRHDPLGIDVTEPRLSWKLQSQRRGQKQTAYQILVATDKALLADNQADLWNTGKIASDQSIHVRYAGQPLNSRVPCYWKVRVWDKDDKLCPFSAPARWEMGLLEAAENGEEVAAVIAHEMTHVTHRHGMRAVMRRLGGVAVVSLVFGGTSFETIAYAAEGLVNQAHSRDQERDADDGGRELLMAAGVDPIGMATFFERLEEEYEAMPESMRKGFAVLSTHPDPGERASTTREIAANFSATRDLPDPPDDLRCHVSGEPTPPEPEPSE